MTAVLPSTTELPPDPFEAQPLTIQVSLTHILTGRAASNDSCAVALALKDRGFTELSVGEHEAIWTDQLGRQWQAELPFAALRFICQFDEWNGGINPSMIRPRPVSFELKPGPLRPDWSL